MNPKLLLLAAALAATVNAGEVEEVERLAKTLRWSHAKVEVRNWDGTRTDMLTPNHAIEVDWPRKWGEAIGQALYYAQLHDRRPGIILLVKDMEKERRYVYRCQTVCAKYGITLWIEEVSE